MYRGAQIFPNKPISDLQNDLRKLADMGANCVRWQLTAPEQPVEDWTIPEYRLWLSDKMSTLNICLPLLEELGLNVLISMMTPIGGIKKTAAGHAHKFFVKRRYRKAFIDIWREIALTYANQDIVLGFQIINEPRVKRNKKLMRVQKKTLAAIRSVSDKKVLFTCKYGVPKTFKRIKAVRDENVWYTCNFYVPGAITHQGIPGSDGTVKPSREIGHVTYPDAENNRSHLERALRPLIKFKRKYPTKEIWIGEYGCTRWSGYPSKGTPVNWFFDLMDLFEIHGFHNTLHAWRECLAWSIEHVDHPNDNPLDICAPAHTEIPSPRTSLFRNYWGNN